MIVAKIGLFAETTRFHTVNGFIDISSLSISSFSKSMQACPLGVIYVLQKVNDIL